MVASTAMKGETMQFLMLPDDLIFNCLARVSRLYHPTLALVSKSFRSLLASHELYKTRTLLGYTESCLYVCLKFHGEPNPVRWFTLCRTPKPKPKPRSFTPCFAPLNENYLVSIPTRRSPPVDWWGHKGVAVLGYNIYYIGGVLNGLPSAKVFYMDCRFYTWHQAPSMQMVRMHPRASVLDGKIYVVEDCRNPVFSNRVECFDPETQIWEYVPSPEAKICQPKESKWDLFGNESVVYKPRKNRWDEVKQFSIWDLKVCVIDNIYFRYGLWNKFQWYDFEARSWRVLKGLEKLAKLPNIHGSYIVDHGGRIAVLWENKVGEKKTIWCVEISFERLNKHEIHGKIEWCDIVLTIPKSCNLSQFWAVTV